MPAKDADSIDPDHIAIVMDGNGRWAKKRLLPRTMGHRAGVKATRRVIENCVNRRIKALTVFAFSSENWRRPEQEVSSLMTLFVTSLTTELDELHRKDVAVNFIGDKSRFPDKLQKCIRDAEGKTKDNPGLKLNIAANYGGRWDILNATRQIVEDVGQNKLSAEDIDDKTYSSYLSLSGQPEPDLFIRSGGESRMSNFLLWQLAYTELYFTDLLWPDFDDVAFENALSWFSNRQRRFGKTESQIDNNKNTITDAAT